MQLTAATVTAILAYSIAKVGALPAGPSTTTESVTTPSPPVPAPAFESVPVYYDPEEGFYIEKRWTPPLNNPTENTGSPGSRGFHGPAPDEYDVDVDHHDDYDHDYDGYGDDVDDDNNNNQAGSSLSRRAIHLKQYKWWQYQTTKPFMGLVGGNPNIRNLNFIQQSRTLGMGLRRRDDSGDAIPLPEQPEQSNQPDLPDQPVLVKDEDGNYYYYYPYYPQKEDN